MENVMKSTRKPVAGPAVLICAFAILVGLPASQPAVAATEEMIDGVLHVRNPAQPPGGVETIRLEEQWRAGADEEGVFFGLIAQALVDDESNIYLLDSQLNQIEVFSPAGEHLRTIGRQGEGPGEFVFAFDMVFMPGGSIGVAQIFPGKLVQIERDGTPAGILKPALAEATAGGFLVLVNCLSAGGNLVLSGIDISFDPATFSQTRRLFLKSFYVEGTPVIHYHGREQYWELGPDFVLQEAETDYVWSRVDVGADGKVAAAIPRQDYEVTIFNLDGSIDRVFSREYTSWERNDRARARITAQLEGQMRQFPGGAGIKIEDHEADVARLIVREDGTIWVLTSRAMWAPKEGVLNSFDVFSPEGEFLKQVDVIGDGSAADDMLLFGRGGLVFQITGFYDAVVGAVGGYSTSDEEEEEEEAPMEVICHRIVP